MPEDEQIALDLSLADAKQPSKLRPREAPPAQEERQRQWGSGEEREHILRRAHQVRGFLRRLSPRHRASELAREFARAAGLVLPDGTTYVRPHMRGGAAPGEPVVRARGLMSLEVLLG